MVGGINVSQVGEQIAETEMQECQNFIYKRDSKRLVGRGGLSSPLYDFNERLRDLHYDVDTNTLTAFTQSGNINIMNAGLNTATYLGKLTGSNLPVCCKFQNKLWIASGGTIQYYDYSGSKGLYTVSESPVCDMVFQRMARLAAIKTGKDTITYSAVGDGSAWEYKSNDVSYSQFLDVGYGDSGDIISVVPLATDMIIIKSNGMVYQFAGDTDFSTWTVTNIANGVDPAGICTATNIGNSVVFLSTRGLKALSATMDYGNISSSDIGDKFNGLITKGLYEPRIFHLKRHSTIMIRPTTDWSFFIAYNYLLGVATTVKFGIPITSMVETSDEIIVASGNCLYKIDDQYTTDNGVPINYKFKPKNIIGNEELLVKSIDTKFTSDRAGDVVLKTGKLSVTMPTNSRRKVKCNHSSDCISLEVTSNTRFELDHIALEMSEL